MKIRIQLDEMDFAQYTPTHLAGYANTDIEIKKGMIPTSWLTQKSGVGPCYLYWSLENKGSARFKPDKGVMLCLDKDCFDPGTLITIIRYNEDQYVVKSC